MNAIRSSLALALLASSCGPGMPVDAGGTTGAADDDGTTTFASTTSTTATTSTTSTSTNTSEGSAETRAETSTTENGGGSVFISGIDAPQEQCDLWIDDCPPGTKCMPWASDNSWSATKCSPIAEDPNQVGEPCTVEGSGISGIDDCDKHSMCWDVDFETNTGTCIAMCSGDPDAPVCADPCTSCFIGYDGFIILCLTPCDPLAQDCDEGEACFPDADGHFTCFPFNQSLHDIGDPCEFVNVCSPGEFCAATELLPSCAGEVGCCTRFCEIGSDSTCADSFPGTECVPWFEEGETPPCGSGVLGGCLLPQ